MAISTQELDPKAHALSELLIELDSVVVAYSGGVDSAYLASAALDALGSGRVLAVTGRSPSYPAVQREMALRLAESIGLPHLEIETREMDSAGYVVNSGRRCFFCKRELYGRLIAIAREREMRAVVDGSNADDRHDHRPGMAAARKLGVRSPLQDVGLTKAEIRALSKRAELPTWDAPASPCLASRLAYGVPVTVERLRHVERAEAALRELRGWSALRVRDHGDLARLELGSDDTAVLADDELRDRAASALRSAGFSRACLDLQGYRRGALNEALGGRSQSGARRPSPELATRALADRGISAAIEGGGRDADVALVRPLGEAAQPRALLRRGDEIVAACRDAGYRFVALALD
jgi:uncharacterized protein